MQQPDWKIRLVFFIRYVLEFGFAAHARRIKRRQKLFHGEVLDIGCGVGNFSSFLSGVNYTGIDLDESLIQYARKHYQGTFVQANATKLPFPDRSFDTVLVTGFFHHLADKDVRKVILEISRVLKNGGHVLIHEDYRPTIQDNILLHFLYLIDEGGKFRNKTYYLPLFQPFFTLSEVQDFASGLWRYTSYLMKKTG